MQQEVSAFGVVAPSLMEESNVLMAERHSINNTLGEDKCLSRNVVEQGRNQDDLVEWNRNRSAWRVEGCLFCGIHHFLQVGPGWNFDVICSVED